MSELNIETYTKEDGQTYNIGRILMAAGIAQVNSAVLAAYECGEIEVTPAFRALITEAQRRNAAHATWLEDFRTNRVRITDKPTYQSEWDLRGSKDGE